MNTEQIAEKAREYAERIRPINGLDKHDAPFVTAFEHNGDIEEAYIKGHEDCNAEWQEKLRWKNINEEKPKFGKLYIVKSNYSAHPIIARYTGPLMLKWILFENSEGRMEINGVTHYREIIE